LQILGEVAGDEPDFDLLVDAEQVSTTITGATRPSCGRPSRQGALEDLEDAHREVARGVEIGPEVGDADPEQPR
jgi:hypothetical protein